MLRLFVLSTYHTTSLPSCRPRYRPGPRKGSGSRSYRRPLLWSQPPCLTDQNQYGKGG
ncbi:hypothetical protein BX600DRAFT_475786 [Xylariales sp. PMI_506]|nr:hypothetical protein BX600DRAFT_475786 [Xylariales sp. PMI_506]